MRKVREHCAGVVLFAVVPAAAAGIGPPPAEEVRVEASARTAIAAPNGAWHARAGAPAALSPAQPETGARPPGWQPAPAGTGNGGLDWEWAVRTAVARYPEVRAARAEIARQEDLLDAARAGYLPRVQARVTSGEQGEFGSGQVATLGVTQVLYDFGKTRSAVRREQAGRQRQEAALLAEMDEVVRGTAEALIEAHRHQELRRTHLERIAALRRVQEMTELRADAGVATRSDPLQARARVEAARSRLLQVESQLREWRSRLATYLGPGVPADVAGAPAGFDEAARAVDPRDIERLPALQVAEAERARAEADLENARAQRYPTLSLEANANRRLGPAGTRYEQIYGKSSYATAFVSLSGGLYQGGALAAQSRASANALQAAEARLQAQRLMAQDELARQRERIAGIRDRMGLLEGRLHSITETRALYWDQYLSLGTRNVLDLLGAEEEIAQAHDDLVNTRHDLWAAQLACLLAAGRVREAFGLEGAEHADGVAIAHGGAQAGSGRGGEGWNGGP